MAPPLPTNRFFARVDLEKAAGERDHTRVPAQHQREALAKLHTWYRAPRPRDARRGALLVLPTGGGKTFTAVRFLCEGALSDGYKVLWLAHTHHLLEQAFATFGALEPEDPSAPRPLREFAHVAPTRRTLALRVVSSTPGHARLASVQPTDDVLIVSLPTAARTVASESAHLEAFLEHARGKLVVVFDEAHHSPAPTYARFIEGLVRTNAGALLLGLTATPVYEDTLRSGWLARHFPDGIVHQTTVHELFASGVLARPISERVETHVAPTVDAALVAQLRRTFGDLPEALVDELAENQGRNALIVRHYVAHRARYGRTLIFADRWAQCEQLATALREHGVRADCVYSHVDVGGRTADARNRRTANQNARNLQRFRSGELDVLVNVRMLTEGTDVPEVQTVFLTRQTTSRVLLTQMVGRALRGRRFGGTDVAYIVSFVDEWKHAFNWARFELEAGPTEQASSKERSRLPQELVSIALVRALARQLYRPQETQPRFVQLLPLGWYWADLEFFDRTREEVLEASECVLVYEDEAPCFDALLRRFERSPLRSLAEPSCTFDEVEGVLEREVRRSFGELPERPGSDRLRQAFVLARHLAQNEGKRPEFFRFEQRDEHDVDALAAAWLRENLGIAELPTRLQQEYERADRYWPQLFPTVNAMRAEFDAAMRRATSAPRSAAPVAELVSNPERHTAREPSEESKREVKQRDGMRCLCCGSDAVRWLQVDHVRSARDGGDVEPGNLQTLCAPCNRAKGERYADFRSATVVDRERPPPQLRFVPTGADASDLRRWQRCVRASINTHFDAGVVKEVRIGSRGPAFYTWEVELAAGIAPSLVEPVLEALLAEARSRRAAAKLALPEAIVAVARGRRADAARRIVRVR